MGMIQPMGLFSGQGGDLIAQEMLMRQQKGNQNNNAFQGIMDNLPQLMQSAQLAKYYGALQAKAQGEAAVQQHQAQVRQAVGEQLKKKYPNSPIGDLVNADLIDKTSLTGALKAEEQQQGLETTGNEVAGFERDRGGYAADPGFIKAAAQASGGDPAKFQAIVKQRDDAYEFSVIQEHQDLAENLLENIQKNISDPRQREIYKAAGVPDGAIPDYVVSNALKDPRLDKAPELKKVLLKKMYQGGVPAIGEMAHKYQTQLWESEQKAANIQKTKSETLENTAQAGQARSVVSLNKTKESTEATKQYKNMHPTAGRSGASSGDKAAKEAAKKQAKMDADADKLDIKIATEAGKGRKTNKVLLRTLQKQKADLDAKRGVHSQQPQSFFGSPQGKAFSKYLGVGQ